MNLKLTFITLLSFFAMALSAQSGVIRGNIFDKETGEPIMYGTVRIEGTNLGTTTDLDGFFSFNKLEAGDYTLVAKYIGYDSLAVNLTLEKGKILYQRLNMVPSSVELATVNVSASKERSRSDVQVSKVQVSPRQIKSLPSTGGDADIAQYLPVLPGVVVTGDQGGQLYIRGGSPIQNKVLLDGVTIYNPFHSIGFFSVFETEIIKTADVLTGGFNAEHGGRISAVVDIKTREGNKKRLSGVVSASPFQGKVLLEGPLKPLDEEKGTAITFLLTGKHSWLDQTSKTLYPNAVDTSFFSFASREGTQLDPEEIGLPYSYSDLYGKVSIIGGTGGKADFFGFNFTDRFKLLGFTDLSWNTSGGGMNFTLIPSGANMVVKGNSSYSTYDIKLLEGNARPRTSKIDNFNFGLDFSIINNTLQIDYGLLLQSISTNFKFFNDQNVSFEQEDSAIEFAAYLKFKKKLGERIIFEPGVRIQSYAAQSKTLLEPRVGLKLNASDRFRIKLAAGSYSQNLISTVNELDIVNFFVGFLSGPEEKVYNPITESLAEHNLQTAVHVIGGVEIDITDNIMLNVEPYVKNFNQLIAINRNKLTAQDPNFVTEEGRASGIDFSVKYDNKNLYLWTTYSYGKVTRNDGQQEYPTVFDRRHNVNFLATYAFGTGKVWEASLRWNLGSGFPFTQTQGFYGGIDFNDLLNTDPLTGNYPVDIILAEERNSGRLPWYHRMDVSVKRTFNFSKYSSLEVTAAVTNAYDRQNIYYIDRLTNTRVDQLPLLPSASVMYKF